MIEKLEEASSGAQAAESEAGNGLDQAVGLGSSAAIEGMTAVKEQIEALLPLITAAREGADEALATAKAVADSP